MTPLQSDAGTQMKTARRRPFVTDVCLISPDIPSSIDFYTDKLGFSIRSRMPGFVDFQGPGVIVALWEADTLEQTTGVSGQRDLRPERTVMMACELDSPAKIDEIYDEYRARGVEFASEPRDYPWNARCVYFDGPNGEFWEFFAWYEGGEPGIVANEKDVAHRPVETASTPVRMKEHTDE